MNIYETTNKVFNKNGEVFVADQTMLLTSNPPQYNVYNLNTKEKSYMFCYEVDAYNAIKYMKTFDLYTWLSNEKV